ncbi:MAG: hypothetical protein OXI87_04945 [Albidovulum sp.]|nr:hypothetical protein [Albidovulum sp.]
MKKITDNQLLGELGEAAVKKIVLEMGMIYARQGRLEAGIDDDETEELFKPYRQGRNCHDDTGGAFRGAGLGLAIAAGVIADHGGEISIANREAADGSIAGLRARVVLPLFQDTGRRPFQTNREKA